ncbi:hypothetical protein [Aeromonas sp. Marseille-Q7275]
MKIRNWIDRLPLRVRFGSRWQGSVIIDENQELDRSPATVAFALAADGKAVASLMKIRNQLAAIVSLAS